MGKQVEAPWIVALVDTAAPSAEGTARAMGKQVESPWIVALGSHGCGECLRCGARLEVTLPQNLLVVTAAMDAFIDVHNHCRPRFKCPLCRRVSWNLNDLKEGYCGYCHDFTDPKKEQWERSMVDA